MGTSFVKELTKKSDAFIQRQSDKKKQKKEQQEKIKLSKEEQKHKDEEKEALDYVKRVKPLIKKSASSGKKKHHLMEVTGGIGEDSRVNRLIFEEFKRLGFKVSSEFVEGAMAGSGRENEDATFVTLYWD